MINNSSQIKISKLLSNLSFFKSENVFNPYRDVCETHDHETSPAIRLLNLELYLYSHLEMKSDSIWIGRDLGYRGGRRTGLALTDEYHLVSASQKLGGSKFCKSTKTESLKERTATEIWNVIDCLDSIPFLWNVFPFHPHERNNFMTNRCHSKDEFSQSSCFLISILKLFDFNKVFALGKDASRELSFLGIEHELVRHPSYGGQTEFRKKIFNSYKNEILNN